jgi:hypothetical protein
MKTETKTPTGADESVMRRRFKEIFGEIGDNVYEKEWNSLYDIWRNAWTQSRRLALMEASTEVASHWNDTSATTNQYQQAQRSSGALQRMALAEPSNIRS